MNNYLLSVYDKTEYNAGPKAKRDISKILSEKLNFKNIEFYFSLNNTISSKINKIKYLNWDIPRKLKNKKIDNIFIQYPIYSTVVTEKILSLLDSHVKVYYIIHDLESLRLFKNDANYLVEEINRLNKADGLVSHNSAMTKWLRENGVKTKISNLEIFDYLTENVAPKSNSYEKTLCYAGNLQKSDFLINRFYPIDVYGPNPKKKYPNTVSYKGVFTPEELPKHLKENFGLIWDGNRIDECNGVYGEYMKYNNPHKVSLYLSSGLPVIIWEKAALAGFVSKHQAGIVVESLAQLQDRLGSLTEEEYLNLRHNAQLVSEKLKKGHYVVEAVSNLMNNK
ncbi:sugar transferase [Ligilactobacillus salivarius]|uniref:Galactofuranose transferase n=1 Tax=Ligilactobacillus salivarius NIAS840 TaxID=1029822 RepID=F5VD94_9LACO|nr:sugar transferase [Ligilactobacillus salivarius]EGL98812.1 galactofuranose transferase [Ligilactobacillus salivarius NIAS840]